MNSKKIKRYRLSEDALFSAGQIKREEHFIKVNNFGTNVRVQTIGGGNPLLFIHGGPNAGSTWAELAVKLTDYKCILLDRPGCGLSESISYKNLSNIGLTDIIVSVNESVLNHFQFEKLSLVGSSFGGYWALKYALQKPERINKLIFEGCPALVEGMAVPKFMKMMTAPVMSWLIPKLPTSNSYSKKIMKDIGHTYSIENNLLPEKFLDWYVSLSNNTDTMKNEMTLINKLLASGKLNPEYILSDDEISKIAQPTLWLWGKDDPFGGIEIGNRLNSKMSNSTIASFDNSGHLPWLDNPEDHATRIKKFIVE